MPSAAVTMSAMTDACRAGVEVLRWMKESWIGPAWLSPKEKESREWLGYILSSPKRPFTASRSNI